ncbi:unnamed protein product [Prorocentrum cordatum]|uniref:Uncharacterized protein n=1 Tax=Prorocentrum cordatum TaxID=2364126 RepID=A0ABN9SZ03_9DINO|nr:unnamed protein product [Polarella glacialis]
MGMGVCCSFVISGCPWAALCWLPLLAARLPFVGAASGAAPVPRADTGRELLRRSRGYLDPLFDCEAGWSEWQDAWTADQKRWCCEQAQRGCDRSADSSGGEADEAPFDCTSGQSSCAEGWSPEKLRWCCEQEQSCCTGTGVASHNPGGEQYAEASVVLRGASAERGERTGQASLLAGLPDVQLQHIRRCTATAVSSSGPLGRRAPLRPAAGRCCSAWRAAARRPALGARRPRVRRMWSSRRS